MAKPGRLPREEQTLPPNIQKALAARASGSNWNEAAEVGKITPVNLRKWRKSTEFQKGNKRSILSTLFFFTDGILKYGMCVERKYVLN